MLLAALLKRRVMRKRLGSHLVWAALPGLIGLVGCNAPAARTRTARREGRINYWLNVAAERERQGADRVAAGVREVGRIWNDDAFKTRRDMREVRRLIVEKTRRWQLRQPAFQGEIARYLAGKPRNIEPTAINLFF